MRIFQHWKILMRSVQGLFFFHFQMRLLKAEGLSGFLIAFLHSIHFAYEVMVLKEISTTQKLILFLYQIFLYLMGLLSFLPLFPAIPGFPPLGPNYQGYSVEAAILSHGFQLPARKDPGASHLFQSVHKYF